MHFNEECLTSQELVNKTNIKLPLFNRRQVKENTKKNPKWIHLEMNYSPIYSTIFYRNLIA